MLKNCRLYVIVDRETAGKRDMRKIAEEALRGGADVIQLRDKTSSDARFLRYAGPIRKVAKKYKRAFILNDRVHIARAVGADGVHLGQKDMPIEKARRIMGKKIIGVSTHNIEQAAKAQERGADYVGIGPIFKTTTKKKIRPVGTAVLSRAKKALAIPFFAIGGISLSRLKEIKKAGAGRIAVVSAATGARDVRRAVSNLKKALAK